MPTDIGEVGLATRSMLTKRAGRPRSCTSAAKLTVIATSAPSRPVRRSVGRSDRSAPAASSDEPPATPPRNR